MYAIRSYYAQKLRVKLHQVEVVSLEEAEEIRKHGIRYYAENIAPVFKEASELGSEYERKLLEYDFWIEDGLLDKFNEILGRQAEVAKILSSAMSKHDIVEFSKKVNEANDIQSTLEPLINEIKRAAKERVY